MTQTTLTKEQIAETCKLLRCAGASDAANLIEALAAQIAEVSERTVSVSFPNHPLRGGVEREYTLTDIRPLLERAEQAEADAASARETLKLILPLAKGYAATHPFGSNAAYVEQAEALLKSTPAPVTPSAPAEADGWRPIETAPRDGTHIMVPSQFTGMEIDEAVYDHDAPNGGGWWSVKLEIPVEPKVWRPIPKPPSAPQPADQTTDREGE